jgi:putative ABC transport system ATP-binding protein
MIQLRNIERTYKTGAGVTYVLRRINLEIREGEFVTVMGPSGSGKSTLMSIIGMLDDSWTGEYYLFEHAVHKLDRKKRSEVNRKYIGFVFQSYHLLDNLTVYESLMFRFLTATSPARSGPAWWLRYSIAFRL